MLGKLIKHELAATGRMLLPMQGILLIISVIGFLLLNLKVFDEHVEIGITMFMFYIFFIFAIAVATQIYLAVRFYKNLFTDEGYLSFTLPVKPYMHLVSKGICMAIWQTVNVAMTVISVCILLLYQNFLGEFISVCSELDWGFLNDIGLSFPGIIGFGIGFYIISEIFSITTIFISVCIGQLANTYKAAASIIAYVVIQVCYQIIASIVTSVTMVGDMFSITSDVMYEEMVARYGEIELIRSVVDMYIHTFLSVMIISGVLSIIFYIASHIIVSKRVNLQ